MGVDYDTCSRGLGRPSAMAEEIDYESLGATAPIGVSMLAGSLAGITEHAVIFPVDSIKTRMQVFSTQPAAIYTCLSMESSAHHGCTVLAAESHATRIPIAVLSRLQPVPEVVVAATLSLVFKRRHGLGVLARKAYCIMS